MKRDVNLFLQDILERIELIKNSVKNLSENSFQENKEKVDANIRRLEIIGEAVKNIPDSFRDKYPKVPWKKISGLRDLITHVYFGIDLDVIWNIIKNDLPKFKKQIEKILKEIKD